MKCPNCGKHIDYAVATQVIHIDVKVDEYGEFIENLHGGDIYDSAYEFEDPCGDYCCPECGCYQADIAAFAE